MEHNLTPLMISARKEIEKCIGCGNCLHTCPVYAEEREEQIVARGRNRLLKSTGETGSELIAAGRDRFDKCLLCNRCTMVCPQGVRNDRIMLAAREELARLEGLPPGKSILFEHFLSRRKTMSTLLRAASRLQWLMPSTQGFRRLFVPGSSFHDNLPGTIRHIPLFFRGLGGGRQLPPIARRFLSELVPEVNPPLKNAKCKVPRIAYFSGCSTEYSLPHVGRALIRLLNQAGVEVLLPRDQQCCGLAIYSSGDVDTARRLALHNLKVLTDTGADLVVTGCATCGSALKSGWMELARDEREHEAFRLLSERARDISELLVELSGYGPPPFQSALPRDCLVTYHDPCHLARHQGIVDQPRGILRQAFSDSFIEMENRGCCGCGGMFNLYHYELSRKIAANKIESIGRTNADIVVNTCPGCMIQLMDNLQRNHLPQQVYHLVEVVAAQE